MEYLAEWDKCSNVVAFLHNLDIWKLFFCQKSDTTICSGSFVWLFSPAWDAVNMRLASSVLS